MIKLLSGGASEALFLSILSLRSWRPFTPFTLPRFSPGSTNSSFGYPISSEKSNGKYDKGGFFADVDKTGEGDTNLYWAAMAANILAGTGWSTDEDDTLNTFSVR